MSSSRVGVYDRSIVPRNGVLVHPMAADAYT
jgi:hypothetical protein